MKQDNVIHLPARREVRAEPAGIIRGGPVRLKEANELLQKLRNTKRLVKADQSVLAGNLGHLLSHFFASNAKAMAREILEENEWEKRKRYIRFADDRIARAARYAASGGTFARIIERLVDARVSENNDEEQAKIEIVRKALKKTSFLPPPPFRMSSDKDDAETAQFIADMSKVFEMLAEEADLADFFAFVSRHPIYPNDAWYQWTNKLELKSTEEPNHIEEWVRDWDEDERDEWIPWWLPKCVIGHWYIPFECRRLHLPEQGMAELKTGLGDKDLRYSPDFLSLIEPFIKPECVEPSRVYHRLPVWLIAMPTPDRLVPCLYVAIHHLGGFYPNQHYPRDGDPVAPCFVDKIAEHLIGDAVYLSDGDNDELNTLYVNISDADVTAIGTRVNEDVGELKDDLLFSSEIDRPEWLQPHPVQKVLRLTADSDAAKIFAMSPRKFRGLSWNAGDRTVFRPAFPDDLTQHTGLRQDTIGAYLLRNLASAESLTIFDALKEDATIKHAAARELFDQKVSSFREAFDQKYGK